MHVVQLLHNFVKKSCVGIHSKRLRALFILVMAVTLGGKLSVAGLGRSLMGLAKAKNKIKQADRLVGNLKLYAERNKFYVFASQMVINNLKQPPIIVDWSGLPNPNYYLLRAAIPTKGRSLTVFEEVHPKKKLSNHKVHKEFLKKLSKMVPQGCKPVIITDAGFHSPFFAEVVKLEWDFVGRIRNLTKYRLLSSKVWSPCKELYKKATKIPKFIDEVILSKSNPIQCFLFLFKGKEQGRIAKNKFGKRRKSKDSKVHAKANKEPWLIATSLNRGTKIAKKVIQLYKTRMQIEEGFRDIKSSRLGFSFEESLTYKPERFAILLLIAMLAILAVTILGKAGEQHNLQYAYQANTIRNRTVLSLFFLGCQMIRDKNVCFSNEELLMALNALISTINRWQDINAC